MTASLRIGTRGSALALWQARYVAGEVERLTGNAPEIVVVRTSGDRDRTSALTAFGGTGAFTRELDAAQRRGDFEISVHSLKDLPTADRDGLVLAAVPQRAPVEDCLVSRGGVALDALPRGARVGTGSPRRAAQLRRLRPDLDITGLRGNVPTRIRMVREGEVVATLLAHAGLRRLELEGDIAEVLDVDRMLPAVGQGALGIVVREAAADVVALVATLQHAATRAAVDAERAVIAELGAGCHMPLGCLAHTDDGVLRVRARVVSADGRAVFEGALDGPPQDAVSLGRDLGRRLLADGAGEHLE